MRLTGSTNGFVFLQFLIESRPYSGVEIRTTELVSGSTRLITMDEVIELSHANYLQVNGVQSGRNTLTVSASGDTDLIDAISVGSDSGILRLPMAPAGLDLRIEASPNTVFPVNTPRVLPLKLSTNGWQIVDVRLSGTVIEGDAEITFSEEKFDTVTDAVITTAVTIVPKKAGVIRVALSARGNIGAGYGVLTIEAE